MFTIIITEKGGSRKALKFDEEIISIGRVQGNEIVLSRGNVSKRHAKLEFMDSRFILTDLGSTNGTYINGRRVHTPTRVYKEDSIYVGDYILMVSGHASLEKDGSASSSAPESEMDSSVAGGGLSQSDLSSPRNSSPPHGSGSRASGPPASGARLSSPPASSGRVSAPPPEPRRTTSKRALPVAPMARGEGGVLPSISGLPELKSLDKKGTTGGFSTVKTEPVPGDNFGDSGDPTLDDAVIPDGEMIERQSDSLPRFSTAESSGAELSTELPMGRSQAQMLALVETVVDHVARQIKRVDRSRTPALLDPGTAGRVRFAIDEYIEDLDARGKLPSSILPNELKGKVFRSVVDLGPVAGWLDDPDVDIIRIIGPRTAMLLKKGEWIEAPSGFASAEDIAEIIRSIGAGLEPREGEVPGISWYRLEEGYLTFTSHFPGGPFRSAIVIDKTLGGSHDQAMDGIPAEARVKIQEAIDARARIGVVGSAAPLRQAIIGQLVALLPKEDFIATVEDIPFAHHFEGHSLRLSSQGRNSGRSRARGVSPLLEHALAVEPSWLVLSGTTVADIPTVLGAAAVRDGVILELPLGSPGKLDRELTVSLTAAGVSMMRKDAAYLLEAAFDLVLMVDRSKVGIPRVARVLASGISKLGEWSPKTLFGPLGGS